MELFFLLRPSLTQEVRKTIGRRRPSSTFSDAFSASNGPIHSQPPLSYPVRAAADKLLLQTSLIDGHKQKIGYLWVHKSTDARPP